MKYGIGRFNCPVCGEGLFGEDGWAGACPHTLFYAIEIASNIEDTDLLEDILSDCGTSLEELEEAEDFWGALVKVLPASCVIFTFTEPARGGGHDGDVTRIGIDFTDAALKEEE